MTLTMVVTSLSEPVVATVEVTVVKTQSVAGTVVVTLDVTVHDGAGDKTIMSKTVLIWLLESVLRDVVVMVVRTQSVAEDVILTVLA